MRTSNKITAACHNPAPGPDEGPMNAQTQARLAEGAPMSLESNPVTDPLADPALRRIVEDFVRRRVPASDVEDVVQTVLCDALAAERRPQDPKELTRWLLGIARHKVADAHRRAHREPPAELPDIEASPAPVEELALARWAEAQVKSSRDGEKTLTWMAREGEGESLEAIAAEEKVPAARVRQRVSRMRRWMKERWLAELTAAAIIAALAVVAWWIFRKPPEEANKDKPRDPSPIPSIAPDVQSPLERARAMRQDALDKCERREWKPCLDGLDEARALDPEGDRAPEIGAARARAKAELESTPPAPSTETSSSATPLPSTVPVPSSSTDMPRVKPAPKSSPKKPFGELKGSSLDYPSDASSMGLGLGSDVGGSIGTGSSSGRKAAPTKGTPTKSKAGSDVGR
uniref:RNA polymerase sigma-70 region 2 domain-containing protein n=1 Tax=Racemicystis crocea TaxID=1707966 RepID=A0A3S5GYL8_9BACT|nr:hypothetical protein [Racemicystis crocea]